MWSHSGRPDENKVETIKLTPAATVSGAVKFANGTPVQNAVVFLSANWMQDGAWTRTDARGNYRIDHLIGRGGAAAVPDGGNGVYDIWVRHDGPTPSTCSKPSSPPALTSTPTPRRKSSSFAAPPTATPRRRSR